ncbi:MAG: hypothetical protein PHS66_08150, partial [Candidatus Omnitrophica bacterium]|nr:hypothetical protein [Candidatus Omnitrophota bacterium]
PLPEMPDLIESLPKQLKDAFQKLKWNSVYNLNLGLEKIDSAARHWVYFPQPDISFFRVGFFHNFSSSLVPAGKNSLYVEIAYSRNKPVDKNKIISQSIKDLKKMNIIRSRKDVLVQDVNDIKYGYPVYDFHYCASRKRIAEFFSKNNIISCGRYGSWRYMSMEDVLLEGKDVAERVMGIS